MIIGIAGPYSAATEEERSANLNAINTAAASVYLRGHIPFVGLYMALPVMCFMDVEDSYGSIMEISMAVIHCCDALLMIGESPGAIKERDLIVSKGLPVYYSVDEIPKI
jgi:hypothetical protein